MTYVEKNLRQNEEVIASAKISFVPLIPSFIIAFIILIIGVNVGNLAYGAAAGLGYIIAIIGIAYAIIQIAKLKTIELAVTNKKIIGKTGVIRVNSIDTYLDRIDNISVSETLMGKLFGYATIQISTTSCRLRFAAVRSAIDFKNVVMDQIEIHEKNKFASQIKTAD